MLPGQPDPYDANTFLANWAAEVRAGYTPVDELDVVMRLNEFFDSQVPPEVEARVTAEVKRLSDAGLAASRADEATWEQATANDRLTAAFAALDQDGVVALERAGLSLQDGWCRVGASRGPHHHGAVFFHTQDVIDALEGAPLLLAYDTAGDTPGTEAERRAIAERVLDTLGRFGLGASWSGHPDDRLRLDPFPWQRRRFTDTPPFTATPVAWRHEPTTLPLFRPSDEALAAYAQEVVAYPTCDAFDVQHATLARGAYRVAGGEWGQLAHLGEPHHFLRAGELAVLVPRDATSNLAPDEAAAWRQRAAAARPPEGPAPTNRPWWRFWA